MKIGILGLGQAGGKIAHSLTNLAPILYSPLAINLAKQDLSSLFLPESRKLHIKWKIEGAGRDPQVPYEALSYPDNQSSLLLKLDEVFGVNFDGNPDFKYKVDFLLIALGSGGGTGNGFLSALIDADLVARLAPIGIILATPREIDSYQEQQNTAVLIQKINESLQNHQIRTVFLLNNDKYSKRFSSSNALNLFQSQSKDWMFESNRHFSMTLTNFFNQTVKPSVKSLDEADLTNMLTKFYGYSAIVFRKGDTQKVLDSTIVALEQDGYATKTATAIAAMVVGRKSEFIENHLLTQIRELTPNASQFIYTGFYESDIDENENHIMISGMDTPSYISKMINDLKDFLTKKQEMPRLQSPDLSFLKSSQQGHNTPDSLLQPKVIGKFTGFDFSKKK